MIRKFPETLEKRYTKEITVERSLEMTISKKMMNAKVIEKNIHKFRCPICSTEMELVDHSRLVCGSNHSFDLSRQGYVNLAPQAHATKYDQSLFAARKTVIDSGFFNPLLDFLTAEISAHFAGQQLSTILDAGCGEGSHLTKILSKLAGDVTGVGIDLAKEGIVAAAKEHPGAIWSVADLAKCPFQDEQFDVVLNILSPANYAEFTRLLKSNGLFIKVVPESGYLKELREVFYNETERNEETNPMERISRHFDMIKAKRITYEFPLDKALLAKLIRMTPLTWGASEKKIAEALDENIPVVTINFNVIISKKGAIECLVD